MTELVHMSFWHSFFMSWNTLNIIQITQRLCISNLLSLVLLTYVLLFYFFYQNPYEYYKFVYSFWYLYYLGLDDLRIVLSRKKQLYISIALTAQIQRWNNCIICEYCISVFKKTLFYSIFFSTVAKVRINILWLKAG